MLQIIDGLSFLIIDKDVQICFDKEKLSKYFNSGFGIDSNLNLSCKVISFDKLVQDVYVGLFNQSYGYEQIYFLLDDGTVEYMPFVKSLKDNNIKSYGKLNDVKDIIRFKTVIASFKNSEYDNEYTTLAIKANGEFYDLTKYIN